MMIKINENYVGTYIEKILNLFFSPGTHIDRLVFLIYIAAKILVLIIVEIVVEVVVVVVVVEVVEVILEVAVEEVLKIINNNNIQYRRSKFSKYRILRHAIVKKNIAKKL